MINKEDYRDFDSLINWGKYAEALEKENAELTKENNRQKIALKAFGILFEEEFQELKRRNKNQEKTIAHYQSKTYKVEKALKECCRHSSCRYITNIKEEYCELNKGHCEDCLFNHFMEEVEQNETL